MKKILIPGIIILLSSVFTFSQESNTTNIIRNSSSLNFYIINGYAVSYKFNNNSEYKFRLHLDLSSNYSSGKTDETYEPSDEANSVLLGFKRDGDSKESSFNISFSPQYYSNIYKTDFAQIYIGAGPNLSFSYRNSRTNYEEKHESITLTTKSKDTNKSKSYSLGLITFIGVEGYVTSNISLFAEVHLSGGKNWSDTKHDNVVYYQDRIDSGTEVNSETENWFYRLSSIRIGLSLYI